jgi:DNA-directed RNA polymerase subunit RPC12/RpoP
MKKRLSFKCWNCERKYSLFKEITPEQELMVACPFCNQEAIVKLEPYKRAKISVLRGKDEEGPPAGYEYQFPDVIPTRKPE